MPALAARRRLSRADAMPDEQSGVRSRPSGRLSRSATGSRPRRQAVDRRRRRSCDVARSRAGTTIASSPLPSEASTPTTNGPVIPLGRSASRTSVRPLNTTARERDREQQQEREARGRVPVEPEKPARGDRDARARHAGHERQALREPDCDALLAGVRSPIARVAGRRSAQPSSRPNPARKIAICHGSPRFPAITSSSAKPDEPRGDRRRDDDPGDALVRRRDRAAAQRPEPRDDERLRGRARSTPRPPRASRGAARRRTSG